jgi:hypothetical protein
MAYYECSVSYHRMKIDDFFAFIDGVKAGYYRAGSPFTAPVMPKAQYEALCNAFIHSHSEYVNGGLNQKGKFMMDRTALMEALDDIKDDVNKVAAGMDTVILEGGFKPRKVMRSKKTKPATPQVEYMKGGTSREILTACKKIPDAESYTCILFEGVSAQGKLRVQGDVIIIPKDLAVMYISESKSRKKSFANLKQFETYYAYFLARNTAGISPLSEERSFMCV